MKPLKRTDLLEGSDTIRSITIRLLTGKDTSSLNACIAEVLKELNYLCCLCRLPSDISLSNAVIRGRVEFMLCCLQHLLPIINSVSTEEKAELTSSLVDLFRIFSIASEEINDNSFTSNRVFLTAEDKHWNEMFSAAISVCIVELLKQSPELRKLTPLISVDPLILISSSNWSVQYIGITLLWTMLVDPSQPMIEKSLVVSSSSAKSKAKSTAKARKAPTPQAAVRNGFIDMCRNGSFRLIFWCSFHHNALIRSMISQIFSAIISLGAAQPGLSNPESTRYELWIAFIEQGLVGIVETISSGAPILNSSDRFPEQPLRIQAQSILLMMANDLCQPQNLHLIERLIATMHHSSNEQLFRNTLLGMLFLSARREALARNFISKINHSMQMPSGLSFLMNVDKDMVATYAFLDMMMHFLHACQLRVAKYAFADQLSNAVPTQTLNGQYQQGDLRAADNFPCTVRIAQRHGRGTRIVRMNCPSIDVIAVYCPEMAVRLSERCRLQFAFLASTNKIDQQTSKDQLIQWLTTIPDDYVELLQGEYSIWQEMFSHMANSYLRNNSISSMATKDVMSCLEYAHYYRMKRSICQFYFSELQSRIDANNVFKIMKLAITTSGATNSTSIHISLLLACIQFLRSHPPAIMTEDKALIGTNVQLLWSTLWRE